MVYNYFVKKISDSLRNYQKKELIATLANTSWVFFDKMFRLLTGLIVSVMIARYLGPSKFGILNYVSVFPLMLTSIAGLGLNSILFNEFVNKDEFKNSRLLVSTSIIMKFASGVLTFFIICAINFLYQKNELSSQLIYLTATSLIIQCLDVVDVYFQSQRQVKYSIIPKLVVFVIATVFRGYGLYTNEEIRFFILVNIAELLFSSVITLSIYIKHLSVKLLEFKIDTTLAKKLIKLSWPIMISELLLFLYVRVDVIMIEQLSNSTELGNFSVAMRITDILYFIPTAITTGLLPSIIILRNSDYSKYLARYNHLLNILVVVGMMFGLFFAFTGSHIIKLVYGDSYIGAASVLSINVWNGVFVFLAIGSDNWFMINRMPKFVLYRTMIGAIINIILDLILIPKFGAIGAALSTLIAQICVAYFINSLYSKTKEIFQLQTRALIFVPDLILRNLWIKLIK